MDLLLIFAESIMQRFTRTLTESIAYIFGRNARDTMKNTMEQEKISFENLESRDYRRRT
jgi:hypothetical protein